MKNSKAIKLGLTTSFLALLAACGGTGQATLPDGTAALRIDCDGTAGGLNYCFERAGKSCGAAGYTIVDPDGQMLSDSDVADSDMESLVRAYDTDNNSVLVRCGT